MHSININKRLVDLGSFKRLVDLGSFKRLYHILNKNDTFSKHSKHILSIKHYAF